MLFGSVFCPKELFGRILGLLGMLPCFDPKPCLHFWDWFSVGKRREFGLMFFIKVVAASVNLMLGF